MDHLLIMLIFIMHLCISLKALKIEDTETARKCISLFKVMILE